MRTMIAGYIVRASVYEMSYLALVLQEKADKDSSALNKLGDKIYDKVNDFSNTVKKEVDETLKELKSNDFKKELKKVRDYSILIHL